MQMSVLQPLCPMREADIVRGILRLIFLSRISSFDDQKNIVPGGWEITFGLLVPFRGLWIRMQRLCSVRQPWAALPPACWGVVVEVIISRYLDLGSPPVVMVVS